MVTGLFTGQHNTGLHGAIRDVINPFLTKIHLFYSIVTVECK